MDTIFADAREQPTQIPTLLRELGLDVQIANLETGSYVLSADVVIERKTASEFVEAVQEGRHVNQAGKMGLNFKRVIWLIEGNIFSVRSQIHPDALDGALSYLTIVMGQTVCWYGAPRRAAGLIQRMAKLLMDDPAHTPAMRKGKVPAGVGQALFTIEGLNGCGPVAARKLLEHFRSVHGVMTAEVEQLCQVKGIGPKKAQAIYDGIHYTTEEGEAIADQPSLFADNPSQHSLI